MVAMRDLYVVSDLHLGRGRNPETGRFHGLENFFFDDDFYFFCRHLVDEARDRSVPFALILNGDTFDFLRVELDGAAKEPGPTLDHEGAARIARAILAGHPRFLDGLAHITDSGFDVVILPGNHDIELQWAEVQQEVRDALTARPGATPARQERLSFAPWFFHEPGRVWIEHGCQYDLECAFRHFLRSRMDRHSLRTLDGDYPLGNFFQRYLYNAFGAITFIVPSSRANFRYFRWLMMNRPRLLLRVLLRQGPFSLKLLRRLSAELRDDTQARDSHETELRGIAASSGLGEKLGQIDALKQVPPSLELAVRSVVLPALKGLALGGGVLFGLMLLWFWSFQVVSQLQMGMGARTFLFLILQFATILLLLGGSAWLLLRSQPDVPERPLKRAASRISALLDVPLVSFGHTHDEAVWRLAREDGGVGWYFNTGTWISVFTHEELVPRERVQLTFLRVRGTSGELMQWSPGRSRPIGVVLLDEAPRSRSAARPAA